MVIALACVERCFLIHFDNWDLMACLSRKEYISIMNHRCLISIIDAILLYVQNIHFVFPFELYYYCIIKKPWSSVVLYLKPCALNWYWPGRVWYGREKRASAMSFIDFVFCWDDVGIERAWWRTVASEMKRIRELVRSFTFPEAFS